MTDAGHHDSGPPPLPPPAPPGGWGSPGAGAAQAPPTGPTQPPPASPPPGGAPYGTPPPPSGPAYPAAPPVGYGQPQGYAYGYGAAPKNDGLAIAALVCGIVAIPFCGVGIVLGVLGVVFGITSMRKIDRAAGALSGRGMALAGAICGGVGLAVNVVYWGAVIIIAISDSSS